MPNQILSPRTLLASYTADIAFVAEEQPATSLAVLAEQVATAVDRLRDVGLDGEDLACAGVYLRDAHRSDGSERRVLLENADRHMRVGCEQVNDYRLML